MNTDLYSVVKGKRGISPAAITTGNATLTTEIIDRQGYEEDMLFLFLSGAITDGTFTITVYEGAAAVVYRIIIPKNGCPVK